MIEDEDLSSVENGDELSVSDEDDSMKDKDIESPARNITGDIILMEFSEEDSRASHSNSAHLR